jgi:hypothetical protein
MNEVDELLLKHAGVPGMKWGVRKGRIAANLETNITGSKKDVATAIVVGTLLAAHILSRFGNRTIGR